MSIVALDNSALTHYDLVFESINSLDGWPSKEKLMIWNIMLSSASGASNAPTRRKGVSKWVNTSNQINNIRIWNNASGDYSNGQIKVWGHD